MARRGGGCFGVAAFTVVGIPLPLLLNNGVVLCGTAMVVGPGWIVHICSTEVALRALLWPSLRQSLCGGDEERDVVPSGAWGHIVVSRCGMGHACAAGLVGALGESLC